MGQRRKSREIALQMLYQLEMTLESPQDVVDSYIEMELSGKDGDTELCDAVRPFAEHLLTGVYLHRDELDNMITAASANWRLERMSIIDRNVLRIALFEMLHCREIPPKVSINEAIDLGKTFGSPDSGAFINGILDNLLQAVNRSREEQASGT
ncbi:MAG: transcription antitermination factor NusB [Syntrophobacteraceae bacterium]|nr:transcription antitermination factor NusB [Syntrophobacteraceae bacterium]